MHKEKTFLAVIPARGGSKGILKKNIALVHGKPLIQYTIDEAHRSKYLDRIIISTDDQQIADVALSCGAEIPFMRPKELAEDKSKTIDSLVYTVHKLNKMGHKYDYLVVLQPTQPLRRSSHIDEAIEKIIEANEDSLVSVSVVKESPIMMRTIKNDGNLEKILLMNSTIRRQDFPAFYKVNGAIYINKLNDSFTEAISLNDNKLAYIMETECDLDIDEPSDLEIFRKFIADHYKSL